MEGSLGDLKGLTFVLDTGATQTFIDTKTAQRAGIAIRIDYANSRTRRPGRSFLGFL